MMVGGIIAEDIPYGIPAGTMAGGGLLGNDMQSASGSAIYKLQTKPRSKTEDETKKVQIRIFR